MIIAAIVLLFLLCTGIGLSQRALMGGAPIINIIFMLLIAVPTPYLIVGSLKSTMPVLYLVLLGSSIVTLVKYFRVRSQKTGKYLMDYDLIMITLPVAASGALFGALMKNLISQFLLSLAAMILMIFLSYKTYKSLRQAKQQNNTNKPGGLEQYLQHHQQLLDKKPTQLQVLDPNLNKDRDKGQFKFPQSTRAEEEMSPQLQKILDEENNRMPKNKIKIILFVLLYTLAILLTKSASSEDLIVVNPDIDIPKDFPNDIIQPSSASSSAQQSAGNYKYPQKSRFENKISQKTIEGQQKGSLLDPYYDTYLDSQGLNNCAVGSFVFIIMHLTLSYLSSKSVAIQTASKDAQKQKYGYVFLKQSQKMGSTKMWNCMISGFFGGIVVGLFGIGTSIVLVPAFVSSQVDQQSALYSSSPSTFLSALVSMSLSGINGLYGPYSKTAIALMLGFSVISTMAMDLICGKKQNVSSSVMTNTMTNTTTGTNTSVNVNARVTSKSRHVILMWLFISSAVMLLAYVLLGYLAELDHFTAFGYFC